MQMAATNGIREPFRCRVAVLEHGRAPALSRGGRALMDIDGREAPKLH